MYRNATAQEVFDFLRNGTGMFQISGSYSIEDILKIMQLQFLVQSAFEIPDRSKEQTK